MNLATAKAYQMKLNFQELWKSPDRNSAATFLDAWCTWVLDGNQNSPQKTPSPQPMKRVARTIKKNADGILNFFDARITNGLLEGINSLIQAAKSKARGYRSTKYFKTIIYLVAGKLDFGVARVHWK